MILDMPFKTCTMCGQRWLTAEDFVCDPTLRVQGYQASLGYPDEGVIVLTHDAEGCGTTLGLAAWMLRPLYEGPEHDEMFFGTDQCVLLCAKEDQLGECEALCGMAWVRKVLQYLRRHELPPHLAELERA